MILFARSAVMRNTEWRSALCSQGVCEDCLVWREECQERICKDCAVPIIKNKHDQLERPARGETPDYHLCRKQWSEEKLNQVAESAV